MDRTFDWADLMMVAVREATRLGLPYEDAQDAAQEAVLRAWRKRRQCRDQSDASSWVASIGRREAYRMAARRKEVPIDPAVWPEPSPHVDQADARIDIRRALGTLPAADRLVLLLRHERDLAHSDIAQIIGFCAETSAVRLHRAHKRLRRVVQSGDAYDSEGG